MAHLLSREQDSANVQRFARYPYDVSFKPTNWTNNHWWGFSGTVLATTSIVAHWPLTQPTDCRRRAPPRDSRGVSSRSVDIRAETMGKLTPYSTSACRESIEDRPEMYVYSIGGPVKINDVNGMVPYAVKCN
jgi:hypothetical protein